MCSPYNSALVKYWSYLKLPDLIVLTNGYRVCWKLFILNSTLNIPRGPKVKKKVIVNRAISYLSLTPPSLPPAHMGREHASRDKKLPMVIFLIFGQMNIYIKGFQKMKIRP